MADSEVTVTFEASISVDGHVHDALAKFARELVSERGVRLDQVTFSWSGHQVLGSAPEWDLVSVAIESKKVF